MKFEHLKCNICGSEKTYLLGKKLSPDNSPELETTVVKCSVCGLIYPDPMPVQDYSAIQKNFDSPNEYFSQDTGKKTEFFKNVLREIVRFKPNKGRIVDVGCGRGEFLYAAKEEGWDAVGTDISETFVRYAKEKYGVKAIAGDLTRSGLEEGSFDAACLISVIQYVQDPKATLEIIRKLLKKDGILYIEATNEDALIFKAANLFKSIRSGKKITTHLSPLFPSFQVYGFDKKSLKNALKRNGFKILSIKVSGCRGGGSVKGGGFMNIILNFARKIVILIGGLIGKGHLVFCIAKKDS